jgi:hypothetical protein
MSERFGNAFDSVRGNAVIGSYFMEDFEWNKRRFGLDGIKLIPMRLFMPNAPESENYRADRGEVIITE